MPNWIGDAVLASAALRQVKEAFPDAMIDLLAKPWIRDLFVSDPAVSRVLVYDPGHGIGRLSPFVTMALRLRRRRYDAALLLQNAFEAALLTAAARIPRRIGYDRDGRGWLLTHPEPVVAVEGQTHETWYYLRLLTRLGITPRWAIPRLVISRIAREHAQQFLQRQTGTASMRAALFPGAAYGPSKRWPAERYAALGKELQQRYGAAIILLGSVHEREVCEQVRLLGDKRFINLSGCFSLATSAAIVKECSLCVANDSGGMHLAAAVGTPVIGIFGATNPAATGPLGPRTAIVQGTAACIPCQHRRCPTAHECMTGITTNMVMAKVEELLHD